MRALTRKAIVDVTRRKGRTILMILGIFIGVLGLTAINEANDLMSGAFFYSTDAQANPNVTVIVDRLPASLATTIQHLPGVEQFQLRATYQTRWHLSREREFALMQISAYQDVQHVQLDAFQLMSGRLPGRGEIVLDVSDQAIHPITLGSTITVEAPDARQISLRVVGLVRTRGLAVWHPPAPAIGYMRPDALQQLVQTISGPIQNNTPRGTEILLRMQDSGNISQTCNMITHLLTSVHLTPSYSDYHYSSFDADGQLGVAGLLTIIRLLAALSLLLGCVMIFNAVSTFLTEQLKIIGTMK